MEQQPQEKKTHPLYRVIRWLVKVFSPKYTLEGTENLPDGPCIIVGNHSQMYGPIAGELYTPGKHAIWCTAEMMNRKEVAEYAFQDFWSNKPKSVRWFYRILSRVIGPLSELIFTNAHTIPVYRDARLISTYRETVQSLMDGNRVVIFPESYTRHNNIVYAFQERFVDTARFYYKRSGEAIFFVPMYLAPRLKTITFGTPVRYRPEEPMDTERKRICEALMDEITKIAVSKPEHTIVPYPNLPKKQYPKNLPLEVYASETAES